MYQGRTQLREVAALRFAIDETMLASGRDYPANRCFCVVPPEPDQGPDVDEVTSGRYRQEIEYFVDETRRYFDGYE